MAAPSFINADNPLSPSEDYRFLRQEGIRLIQELSGKSWTDYNTHDPGITLLEAMCYAMTDLGYRTAFDMKDILASKEGSTLNRESEFYTARQILPCNPVSLTDYRKLIIDTEGVRNAWVEMSQAYEVPLIITVQEDETDKGKNTLGLAYEGEEGKEGERLRLKGLYKVLVEFEEEVLRENKVDKVIKTITDKLQFHRNLCEDFLTISSIEYECFTIEAEIRVNEGSDIEKINALVYKVIQDYISPAIVFYSLEQMIQKGYSTEEIFEGPVLKYGFIDTVELERAEKYREVHLSDIIQLISSIKGVIAVMSFKLPIETQSPFSDFRQWVTTVKDQQKAPKLDVAHSRISFTRNGDRHRSPAERQPDKQRVEAMLSFLQSTTFQSKLKNQVNDFPIPTGEDMAIADYYPFQNSLPSCYGMTESYVDEHLDSQTIQSVIRELEEFEIRQSERKPTRLSAKASLLNRLCTDVLHMPLNGISSPEELDQLRKVYIRHQVNELGKRQKLVLQLRGYLAVFEQILSDYLSQLAHLRELFSFDPSVEQTCFPQVLKGIGDLEALFIDYQTYATKPEAMVESPSDFERRRNLMLDHLLGRLAEDMTNYSSYMTPLLKEHSNKRLRRDKIAFLRDYIPLSNYRGQGFDYTKADNGWNTNNVEGIKKRICRLLGMPDFPEKAGLPDIPAYQRKQIAPDFIYVDKIETGNNVKRYVVKLADPDNRKRILLESEEYVSKDDAYKILHYFMTHGLDKKLYKIQSKKDKHTYQLLKRTPEEDDESVASQNFTDKYEMERAWESTLTLFREFEHSENFHVLEHILLRPRINRRERTGRSHLGRVNADRVDLLPVLNAPVGESQPATKREATPYRFEIFSRPDAQEKDKTIWKLRLVNDRNVEILAIDEAFDFEEHARRRAVSIREVAADQANYQLVKVADGYFIFHVSKGSRTLATGQKKYRKEEERSDEIDRLVNFFSYELQPLDEPSSDEALDMSSLVDPYSFQVSFILPNWPARFRDAGFKHLVEKTIFLETPAHVYPRVYWVDHRQMRRFERAYRSWLEEMAGDDIANTEEVNELLLVLNEIQERFQP